MIEESNFCAECGNADLLEEHILDSFQYGDALYPEKQVTLSAVVPVYECKKCKFKWTDCRAEDLRDKAVREHLGKIQ